MGVALFGKHPAFGDFLTAGLAPAMGTRLEQWLEAVLPELRDAAAARWPAFWHSARPLRFWMGEALVGEGFCGVIMPSADRVGRRYPLILGLTDADPARLPAPPVITPDQTPYDLIEAELARTLGQSVVEGGVAGLLGQTSLPPGQGDGLAGPSDFWAERAAPDPAMPDDQPRPEERLLADVAMADHRRACATRSYFWTVSRDGHPARFHAGADLPGASVLGWLLAAAPPTEENPA